MVSRNKDFTLTSYTDVDWVGSVVENKSTSEGAFYLGKCPVSWLSKKRISISLSTIESKYIVVASCCTQVIWMK